MPIENFVFAGNSSLGCPVDCSKAAAHDLAPEDATAYAGRHGS